MKNQLQSTCRIKSFSEMLVNSENNSKKLVDIEEEFDYKRDIQTKKNKYRKNSSRKYFFDSIEE